MIDATSSFPIFIVKDLETAKSYYITHFGFRPVFENEWYLHLVSAAGIQIGFMLPDLPTQPDLFQKGYSGSGVIFSLEVDDAAAAFAYATAQGLKMVLDLRSEDWGQRHFSLEDPNGIFLDIVQAIEPTAEYREGYVDD